MIRRILFSLGFLWFGALGAQEPAPEPFTALLEQGRRFELAGDLHEAEKLYRQALALRESADLRGRLGFLALERGEASEASAEFQRAALLSGEDGWLELGPSGPREVEDPQSPELLWFLRLAQSALSRPEGQEARRLRQLYPDSPEAMILLGQAKPWIVWSGPGEPFWIQLGRFRVKEGAETEQRRLKSLGWAVELRSGDSDWVLGLRSWNPESDLIQLERLGVRGFLPGWR